MTFLTDVLLKATVKDEMLRNLIEEHSKLIDNLIEVFKSCQIDMLVRYFCLGTGERLSDDKIKGTTARDFFNHLVMHQKFTYYAPDTLLDFVAATHDKLAIGKVNDYIKYSHNTLLTDLNLVCESKRVEKENIQSSSNKKILQIKTEAKPLSSEKESFIRYTMCKCLKMPPNSISFLGPIPGCITLVYKCRMSDTAKQQLLQKEFLVTELAPLADLNVVWLRIDNETELRIPLVKEFDKVKIVFYFTCAKYVIINGHVHMYVHNISKISYIHN